MQTRAHFKVITFKHPSGTAVYRVTGYDRSGKQLRKNFGSLDDATLFAQKCERIYLGLPEPEMQTVTTRLTSEQAQEAEACYRLLRDKMPNKSMPEILEWAAQNYRETAVKILLARAFEEFIAAKQKAARREDTIRDLNDRVGRLCKLHPTKLVSDVVSTDIEAMINQGDKKPISKANDRRVLSQFFTWACSKGYCSTNPVNGVERIKVDEEEPEILSLADSRKLISAAVSFKDGICLPYVALGLFCGIRPKELNRLTWNFIDLAAGTIKITGAIAKKRARRIVEMPANAIEFLLPHAKDKTPITPTKNARKLLDAVKAMAGFGPAQITRKNRRTKVRTVTETGLTPMVPDAMRHTATSMHLAKHEHEGKTATWAGNSPDVIQKHYKGLVDAATAKEFWAITPASLKGNIVPLPAAVA